MLPFLLWDNPNQLDHLQASKVASKFYQLFASLFKTPPRMRTIETNQVNLVYFDLEVKGWKPSFYQENQAYRVLALNYPSNGHAVVRSPMQNRLHILPHLAQQLQTDTANTLSALHPPVLLFWEDKIQKTTFLVNDGLGFAQLFEYQTSGQNAYSNRIWAFTALALVLDPVPAEWALRSCLGWFPLDLSGFKNVRHADPATLYRWRGGAFKKQPFPVLEKWVTPQSMSETDCLELATESISDYLQTTKSLYSNASGGLTGGFDSRAIFALCRHLELDIVPRVKGPIEKADVKIAK